MIPLLDSPRRLALASAALSPLLLAAAAPQEPSAPAGRAPAAVVIRYDPASIYLTAELVQALCDSSVRIGVTEGPLAGQSFGLAVEAFPGREHQPPGVFPCKVRLTGERVEGERGDQLVDRALAQLEGALGDRLTDGRVSHGRDQLNRLMLEGDRLQEQLQLVQRVSALTLELAELEERAFEQRVRAESLELEIEVAGANWRAARARTEGHEQKLQAAVARVDQARLDLDRVQSGLDKGLVSQQEVQKARVSLVAAESDLASAAAVVQESAAQAEVIGARRKALEAQLEASMAGRDRAEAQRADVAARLDGDAGTSADEARLLFELQQLQERTARTERALDSVIEVRVERW